MNDPVHLPHHIPNKTTGCNITMVLWHQVLSEQNERNSKGGVEQISVTSRQTASDALSRESYVLLGGTSDGIKAFAQKAIEEPGETAFKLASSAAIGGAFAYLHARPGLVGITGRIAGGALAVAFAADCLGRVAETGKAMSDAWSSGENLDGNRAIVASTLGPFIVDSAIMTVGGTGGALLSRSISPRVPYLEPKGKWNPDSQWTHSGANKSSVELASSKTVAAETPAPAPAAPRPIDVAPTSVHLYDAATIDAAGAAGKDLYWTAWPSIIKVTRAGKSSGGTGTGFIVNEEGLAVTNYHVVANGDLIAASAADGKVMKAQVVRVDPTADLALIQLDTKGTHLVNGRMVRMSDKLDPIRLAGGSDDSVLGQTVYAFGHNAALKDTAVAVGTLKGLKTNPHVNGVSAPLNPKLNVYEGDGYTRKGFSGGPVVNGLGEVVAVNFASNEAGVSYSVPVSALKELVRNNLQHRSAAFWQGIVPMLKQAGRSPQAESGELAGIYASSRESVFKVRAIKGKEPEVGSGFLVSDSGHVITSSKLVQNSTDITLNKNGLWNIPMRVEAHLDEGMALLVPDAFSRHYIEGTPFRLSVREPNVVANQRLTALGYPADQMQMFAAAGDFAGYVKKAPHSLLGLNFSVEPGFAGAPILNRVGRVVGVSLGGENVRPVSLGAQSRVLAEALKLRGIAVDGVSTR